MLFKLIQNPARKGELMGYEWIEVLAIAPFGIAAKEANEAFSHFVSNQMLCNTPMGLTTMLVDDVFDSLFNEYILDKSGVICT